MKSLFRRSEHPNRWKRAGIKFRLTVGLESTGEGREDEECAGREAVIGIDRDFPKDKPRRMGHSYMETTSDFVVGGLRDL